MTQYDAVPRVVFTDPRRPPSGRADGPLVATIPLAEVPRTYALGPDAGEWLQQATLAIRARVPLELVEDVIQPFPTFSEVFQHALPELRAKVPAAA